MTKNDLLTRKLDQDLKKLQLLAKDFEDLQIMSAHLQDALTPLTTMIFDPPTSTFSLLANRFCWEHEPFDHEDSPLYHRVHSGVCFRHVEKVLYRGIDLKGPVRTLNLLSVKGAPTSVENGLNLDLVFSGDGHIRLQVKELHCHLGDLHHAWPTRVKPKHIHEHLENTLHG